MKKEEDCYFYVNGELGKVRCVCTDCIKGEAYQHIDPWFWPGSTSGYGPFNFICESCKRVVHAQEETPATSEDSRG